MSQVFPMNTLDHSWMYRRTENGVLLDSFTEGVNEFIEFALRGGDNVVSGGKIKCPCKGSKCKN